MKKEKNCAECFYLGEICETNSRICEFNTGSIFFDEKKGWGFGCPAFISQEEAFMLIEKHRSRTWLND